MSLPQGQSINIYVLLLYQFLADMTKMGQKAKYEAQITGEVAVRLKQLKKLDEEIKKMHYLQSK